MVSPSVFRRYVMRIAIDRHEHQKVDETNQTRSRKAQPPPHAQQQQANQRHADRRTKLCRTVKKAGCETPFPRRKPVSDGLGIGRKRGRLANSQQKPRRKKSRHAARNGRPERRNAPDQRAREAYPPHPEAVQQNPRRKLARSIGPAISAQQKSERDIRDAEFLHQSIV